MRRGLFVLAVQNDNEVMKLILEQLISVFAGHGELECASTLSLACESLADSRFDAILFDLSLANNQANSALAAIRACAPDTPLFLLLDKSDQLQGIEWPLWRPGGCVLKHELGNPAWLKGLCAAVACRETVSIYRRN